LTKKELAKVNYFLAPGGRAVLMFYAPGYTPETHKEFGIEPTYNAPPKKAVPWGNYHILDYTKGKPV
jgi:hypothetical protein